MRFGKSLLICNRRDLISAAHIVVIVAIATRPRYINSMLPPRVRLQADTFSAKPGYSEHQAGLAFDIRHGNGTLVTNGPAAEWISANAHKYGFIVRYQSGKEHITGYSAEPWHLR